MEKYVKELSVVTMDFTKAGAPQVHRDVFGDQEHWRRRRRMRRRRLSQRCHGTQGCHELQSPQRRQVLFQTMAPKVHHSLQTSRRNS
jgi:hypothetical protein